MVPVMPTVDLGDGGLVDTIVLCDGGLLLSEAAASANVSHSLFRELGVVVPFSNLPASGSVGVGDVFLAGQPAEIAQPVVGSVEVNVVPLLSGFRISNKSPKHKSVDHFFVSDGAYPENDAVVSGPSDPLPQHPSSLDLDSAASAANGSIKATDVAEVRHLVHSLKAVDCFPGFCGRIFTSHRVPFAGLRSGL